MTSVAPTGVVLPAVITPAPDAPMAPAATSHALPEPLLAGLEPSDALSVLLLSMERANQASMSDTENQVRATRHDIKEQLDKYLTQLQSAIESADDDGGWFSDLIGSVADVIGSVVGAVADVFCDYVTFPIDVTVDVVQSIRTSQSLWTALQSDLGDFGETGEAGQAVKGFTAGVTKFAADTAAVGAKLSIALGKPGASPADILDSVKDDLKELGRSLDKNILSNPDFWKVMSTVAKAAAVGGTLATGGALGIVCIGLMALTELDKQTGFIERVVGEKAAPWVRLGVQLAASACGAFAGSGGSSFLRSVQSVTKVAQGADSIVQGVKAYVASNERADELERQAELTGTLNRMRQLQRLCEELLDTLSDKNDDHKTQQDQASGLFKTKGDTELASIPLRA